MTRGVASGKPLTTSFWTVSKVILGYGLAPLGIEENITLKHLFPIYEYVTCKAKEKTLYSSYM